MRKLVLILLTHSIIQSRRLTLFGHIMRMDDNADAKRILLASPPADWRRQLGRPCITWLSTVQQDLKQHHLTLPKAADLAQNHPLWRMMSTYGATQSWVACQKRRTTTTARRRLSQVTLLTRNIMVITRADCFIIPNNILQLTSIIVIGKRETRCVATDEERQFNVSRDESSRWLRLSNC